MQGHQYISADYFQAREAFRREAEAAGGTLRAYPIDAPGPGGEQLTIDAAWWGPEGAQQAVVLSSGTHGVEGYLGSAIQRAVLAGGELMLPLPEGCGLLLIHAVNPYGFAWTRRVNEDSIDLNRNFLLQGEAFSGAPDGYAQFHPLINPESPPVGFEAFYLRAGWNILRHGLPRLKAALASGQYEEPKGLFFGGKGPAQTQTILREILHAHLAQAQRVVHLDFHTGLGAWGDYTLALSLDDRSPKVQWLKEHFGRDQVEALDPQGTLYVIRGVLGDWLQEQLPDCSYHCLLAEFGTYPILKVVYALRQENRAWHWGARDSAPYLQAQRQLKEAFAPADPRWGDEVVGKGLGLVRQAWDAVQSPRTSA